MPPKTLYRSKPGPKTYLHLIGRASWNSTTRKDRAIIRILNIHGLSREAIAKYVGFKVDTVKNILEERSSRYADEDRSQDYDFVDDPFRAIYPPPSSWAKDKNPEEGAKKLKIETVEVGMNRPPLVETEPTAGPSSAQAHVVSCPDSSASSSALVVGSSHEHPIILYQGHLDERLSGNETDPIIVDFCRSQAILEFLSQLDHDLSGIIDIMGDQDLGTPEQLFSIADWPEETLHQLFKEALPNISITQRFVLVKGLKSRSLAREN